MKEETKEVSILEQVKKAEKVVKTHLLMKQLSVLKDLAKDILEAKEETRVRLQELGISEEDSKKVIDFINSLPETQLSDEDKKEIRENVKSNLKQAKQEVQRKIESSPVYFTGLTGLSTSASNSTSSSISPNGEDFATAYASNAGITLTAGSNKVDLNI